MVLAVSQSKMEVEFGISLIIPAITCVAYFGRSNNLAGNGVDTSGLKMGGSTQLRNLLIAYDV